MPADKIANAALGAKTTAPAGQDPVCRMILPAPESGWDQLAMGEWELRAAGFGDCHPHDEVNYVLEGRLYVDCDGETVRGDAGDVIRVPADHAAYYRAPDYARMLFVYGPNPLGRPTRTFTDSEEAGPPKRP